MSVQVAGKCLGLKTTPAKEQGKQPTITGGIAFPVPGGFKEQETLVEVRFFPEQITAGKHLLFQQAEGKQVVCPVNIRARAYNGQAYVDYNCAGDLIVVAAEVKKAANA